MLTEYIPVVVLMGAALALAVFFTLASIFLGPKRQTPVKQMPFECGNPSVGNPRRRFSAKFYMTAVLFILFDIEAVFLYPWAVSFRELSSGHGLLMLFGIVEMGIFLMVLGLLLYYVWRKGALEWD